MQFTVRLLFCSGLSIFTWKCFWLICYLTFTHTLRTSQRKCNHTLGNNRLNYFTCSNNLTLSMGATAVLEMAAAMPPAKKSFMKLITPSAMVGCVDLRPLLLQTSPSSSRKPNAPPSGRGPPICPNISAPFIARILSDGFAFCQTENQGWINIRGESSRRAPCSQCQEWVNPGTFKGHNMCYFTVIRLINDINSR